MPERRFSSDGQTAARYIRKSPETPRDGARSPRTTLPPLKTGSSMDRTRFLIVTADDFGIGPSTSRGIVGLASRARVTATVLLVNAPDAEGSVRAWRSAGEPVELGWHPCLTLDSPIVPASEVRSLVDERGQFLHLAPFLRRLALGAVASK